MSDKPLRALAYGDSVCVVRTEQTPQGTSIRLKLSNRPS